MQGDEKIAQLRSQILEHLALVGLPGGESERGLTETMDLKVTIRRSHSIQRKVKNDSELTALKPRLHSLLDHFASGGDVVPELIEPTLEVVDSSKESGSLFRLATTLWSVPVSRGFGRRIRFLVRDNQNGKLIGIFALGDPVFNLRARDNWIGWSVRDREERLVHLMDAFVVGAVPPYSELLGGKLVASLVASREVGNVFNAKYGGTKGVISKREKNARLTMVTMTSALGRSSIYNRLSLGDMVQLRRLGYTEGWGHFQISDEMFESIRGLLSEKGHPYADGNHFGSGPNWRIRVIREGLKTLGLDSNILKHGIKREVFAMTLAENWREFLLGSDCSPRAKSYSLNEIASAAKERWILPRALRRPGFREWTAQDTMMLLDGSSTAQLELPLNQSE